MSQGLRRPWQAVDYDAVQRLYPPPPEYYETAWYASADEIAHTQLSRLKEKAWYAYRAPFHKRRWDAAGFHPSQIKALGDLWQVPFYTVDDIRKSIDEHPPWGDYQGVTPDQAIYEPMRVYMSGGTTGKSRPTFYTAWDREVGAVMFARQMFMQGVRPGDVVINSWSYGLHNGAHSYDESLYRWLNCVVLTASTGTVTSSERQVELALAYDVSSIMTTGDYLLRLEEVAERMGTRLPLRAIPNIGDRKVLEEKFGLEYFDSYGFHEVQTVAVECPAHDGLHIFEDAYIIQIVDPETGEPLPDGELGAICVTELYKTGSSQFRYNIMDLSYLYPSGQCACGSWLRRMGPFSGRGDNMVKLRGVNVCPEAVGDIAHEVEGATTDYFVRAVREGNRDELVVSVVSDADPSRYAAVQEAIEERLHARLGLKIRAEVVAPGAIDEWTEIHTSPKPKRFRDERR